MATPQTSNICSKSALDDEKTFRETAHGILCVLKRRFVLKYFPLRYYVTLDNPRQPLWVPLSDRRGLTLWLFVLSQEPWKTMTTPLDRFLGEMRPVGVGSAPLLKQSGVIESHGGTDNVVYFACASLRPCKLTLDKCIKTSD